jgi:hypothetical protein
MTPYIFVSHSRKDNEKARRVRDHLESRSFEPILFNLKCLTDDDELTTLVKREIEARPCFLYLDSPNARVSERVIRNSLEEKGFDPLCFYMMCLTDED